MYIDAMFAAGEAHKSPSHIATALFELACIIWPDFESALQCMEGNKKWRLGKHRDSGFMCMSVLSVMGLLGVLALAASYFGVADRKSVV